jgi:cytochrome c
MIYLRKKWPPWLGDDPEVKRMRRNLYIGVVCLKALLAVPMMLQAATVEELANESEALAAATAENPATPEQIMAKVQAGVAVLEKEGKAAMEKFRGKDSPFIFGGTYLWIHDMKGVMLMHPIKYKMNGLRILGQKDSRGKRFFKEMNQVARTRGSGWVDYYWPKPGEKEHSQKVSFVKLARVEGEEWVVGCGIYNLPKEKIAELVGQ